MHTCNFRTKYSMRVMPPHTRCVRQLQVAHQSGHGPK